VKCPGTISRLAFSNKCIVRISLHCLTEMICRHLDKQNHALMETYRAMSHELHKLQVSLRYHYAFILSKILYWSIALILYLYIGWRGNNHAEVIWADVCGRASSKGTSLVLLFWIWTVLLELLSIVSFTIKPVNFMYIQYNRGLSQQLKFH
jgi:hypothetical protein